MNCRKLYTALALLAALSQCFNEELGSSLSGQEYNQLVTVTGDSVLVSLDICTVELSSDLIALLVATSTRFQNLESIPCRFQNTCRYVDIWIINIIGWVEFLNEISTVSFYTPPLHTLAAAATLGDKFKS